MTVIAVLIAVIIIFITQIDRQTRCNVLYVCRGFTYYKMANLDNRIANADQLLTQDVEKLSNSIAELYSNLSKVFSLVLMVFKVV